MLAPQVSEAAFSMHHMFTFHRSFSRNNHAPQIHIHFYSECFFFEQFFYLFLITIYRMALLLTRIQFSIALSPADQHVCRLCWIHSLYATLLCRKMDSFFFRPRDLLCNIRMNVEYKNLLHLSNADAPIQTD